MLLSPFHRGELRNRVANWLAQGRTGWQSRELRSPKSQASVITIRPSFLSGLVIELPNLSRCHTFQEFLLLDTDPNVSVFHTFFLLLLSCRCYMWGKMATLQGTNPMKWMELHLPTSGLYLAESFFSDYRSEIRSKTTAERLIPLHKKWNLATFCSGGWSSVENH